MSESDLSGKVGVVTGAGRGIGRGTALRLASAGVHVICVSKNESSCESVASLILKSGLSAEYIAVDVSNAELVATTCEGVLSKHGTVDILVNNAGITRDNVMLRMSDGEWNDVIDTNLSSCFYWTKGLLKPMLKERAGRIINVSSIVGCVGNFGQANYAAAKAGIIGFTKSVAREVATRGITVNAVAPGFIRTDMTNSLNESIIEKIRDTIPMRQLGEVDDVASVIEFLCSRRAKYITGQIIRVDGGMCM
ncbi:MAG: 3-oxoacyl-[acyl-carrier-protein] reductase [Puniceicoccales bacterium]|jgi:3-oxoacyl-[acyl-carrier protein] reductase|nr:3-oxoacyl-[acyl-carrier-protein] reductase [Puniceicoccales bacterium]